MNAYDDANAMTSSTAEIWMRKLSRQANTKSQFYEKWEKFIFWFYSELFSVTFCDCDNDAVVLVISSLMPTSWDWSTVVSTGIEISSCDS